MSAGEEPARVAVQAPQRVGQIRRGAVLHLLEQHLAVADDVAERRAQLVARVGEDGGLGCSRRRLRPEERLDLPQQPGQLDGLGVVVVAARGQRLVAIARHRVRGQRDHRDVAGAGPS